MSWYIHEPIAEDQDSELYVLKENFDLSSLKELTPRTIYEENSFRFHLLYNDQMKMQGYKFNVDFGQGTLLKNKTVFENSALWFFTEVSKKFTRTTTSFEIMYEDQVVRLLSYEHEKKKDYWLVGRWRQKSSKDES